MGSILQAVCEKCGFEHQVWYGGGMANFQTVCDVPAINIKSGEFVVENILRDEEENKDLIFYTDKKMYKGKIGRDAHQWREFYLNFKNNLCPKCKTFSLNFEGRGCWD